MLHRFLTIITIICGFGMIVNILLLFVIIRCPLKSLSTYKLFFLSGALQDLTASICYFLVAPTPISEDGVFIYIATGPASRGQLSQALLTLSLITAISALALIMNNFVYRYIHLCKTNFLFIYHSFKWSVVITSINAALVLNWVAMLYVSAPPTPLLIRQTRKYIMDNYEVDPYENAFFGLSVKFLSIPHYILLVESFLLIIALGIIGALCAWRIHHCLKVNAMSAQTKKMHRHMLIMLGVQTLCPALFLDAPFCVMYLLVFTGARSPNVMSYAVSFLMATFTIFSPLVVLMFMNDYRNFILVTLHLRKPRQTNAKVIASLSEARSTRSKSSPF